MANFTLHRGEYQPPGLVHMPAIRRAAALEDLGVEGLEEIPQELEASRESSRRNEKSFKLQGLVEAVEGTLKEEFIQNRPDPELRGKEAFGDDLGGHRRGYDSGNRSTVTDRNVAFSFVNAADQTHLPMDLLGVLGPGEGEKGFVAAGTTLFPFREIVDDLFSLEIFVVLSAVAFRSPLFSSLSSLLGVPLGVGLFRRGGRSGRRFLGFGVSILLFFRLVSEDLPLEPCYLCLELFIFSGKLGDLSNPLSKGHFELVNLLLQASFALAGSGMLRFPVVGLEAKFNDFRIDFNKAAEHAGILREGGFRVQLKIKKLCA